MSENKADFIVDVTGETCPIPLVEMRKAVMKAATGQVIEVIGTHGASRKEIPMAVKSLGLTLLADRDGEDHIWHLLIKK